MTFHPLRQLTVGRTRRRHRTSSEEGIIQKRLGGFLPPKADSRSKFYGVSQMDPDRSHEKLSAGSILHPGGPPGKGDLPPRERTPERELPKKNEMLADPGANGKPARRSRTSWINIPRSASPNEGGFIKIRKQTPPQVTEQAAAKNFPRGRPARASPPTNERQPESALRDH